MLSETEVRELRAQADGLDDTEDIVTTIDYILGDSKVSPLDFDTEDVESEDNEFESEDEDEDEDEEELEEDE